MDEMRLFCEVARCRSFSQAAKVNGVTQSAASQRIHALEKRLGVELVDRSVRPLALTPAGELLFRDGQELLKRYDLLERRVSQMHLVEAGHVSVDAIYSAGIDLLNRIKDEFEASHPRVTVTLEYKRPEEVYEAVRQLRCDLGILSYPQRWRGVGVALLREETMGVVCSPGHELAEKKKVRASELGRWPMVCFESSLPVARSIRRFLKQNDADPEVTGYFDNVDTIKNVVAVTNAFSILPRRTVWREEQSGQLAVVELEPRLVRPLGIIHPKRNTQAGGNGADHRGASRLLNPAVQAFVDYLMEHAGPNVDLVEQAQKRAGTLVGARS